MTVVSTLRRTNHEFQAMEQRKAELEIMPAIDFWTVNEDEQENADDKYERHKDLYVSLEIKFDLTQDDADAKTYTTKIKCFKQGTPEEYCAHRAAVHDAATKLGYLERQTNAQGEILDSDDQVMTEEAAENSEADLLIPLAKSTLRGHAGRVFTKYLEEHTEDENGNAVESRTLYVYAWNAVATAIFQHPLQAAKYQKRYLKEGGLKFCGQYKEPRKFYERLDQVNGYLPYFPLVQRAGGVFGTPTAIASDEKIEILDKARTDKIRSLMLANRDSSRKHTRAGTYAKTLQEWYDNVALATALENKNKQDKSNKKRKPTEDTGGPKKKKKKNNNYDPNKSPCRHCGRVHPGPDSGCWTLDKNKAQRPDGYRQPNPNQDRNNNQDRYNKRDSSSNHKYNKKDFDQAVSRAVLKATKQLKKQFKDKSEKKSRNRHDIHDAYALAVKTAVGHKSANYSDSEGTLSSDESIPMKGSKKSSSDDSTTSSDDSSENSGETSDSTSVSTMDSTSSHSTSTSSDTDNVCYAFYEHSRLKKKHKSTHYTAETVVEIEDRYGNLVPIKCLIDTGTSESILLRDFVRKGRAKSYKGKQTQWNTLGGQFTTKQKALVDFCFPELNPGKKVTWICHVDANTNREHAMYDMIIGLDLLTEIGLFVNTETKCISWQGHSAPLKHRGALQNSFVLQELYAMSVNPVLEEAEQRQARILDADYSKPDIDEYVKELQYLSVEEQQQLSEVLNQFPTLFGGGLGRLNIPPIDLKLKPGAQPYHARPYPVPQSLYPTTKKEMGRLTDINVFDRNSESEWAAPTFIQPKKTGDVRILTDFRKLNEMLIRKPFPLPKIQELLQKLRNFKYATAIDLSMGYYHIPLSEESQKLCTTVLPWGKYRCKVLPMGIKNSPDIFQEVMTNMFCDLEYTSTYIDDILIISDGTYADHLAKLQVVLGRLQKANFRANVRKCYFAKDNLEYLGYQITREGIQPQPKKVEAIQKIKAPTNVRQLRRFLGMVNYYRDMWKRRSHILAPLTKLVGKGTKWEWNGPQQQAFEEIKRVMARETILSYPDFSKPFHIYTDASDYQLGAVIMQDDKPLAFYSRKLNSAQKNYTTGEQELLSIVETVKEFRTMLWGNELIIHTDHKNIIYGNLSNDRITRWRLILEEYSPTFLHIKGQDNIVADALSRLDKHMTPRDGDINQGIVMAYAMSTLHKDESTYIPEATNALSMAECYAKKKDVEMEAFPMSPELIAKYQLTDKRMRKLSNLEESQIEGVKLMTTQEGRIYIPSKLRQRIVAWYHLYLRHPGATRLEKTLRIAYWWPDLRRDVEAHTAKCHQCQKNKKIRKKHGKIPAKEAEPSVPWDRCNIDLIGPLTVKAKNGTFTFDALTMIDPATGWFEMKELTERTANMVAKQFDDCWLSRYPRPTYIGFDNGGENKGMFDVLMRNYGMKRKSTTTYNPQSNGIVERVHAVLNDTLRTFELEDRELYEADPWTEFLSAASFAIRATYHTTLEATPAQLVFGRDMILPISVRANWARIKEKRQMEILRNNARENQGRVPHTYKIEDKVLLRKEGILRKLTSPRDGPYEITRVYDNGTVQIQQGAISERVNIRRLTPYNE